MRQTLSAIACIAALILILPVNVHSQTGSGSIAIMTDGDIDVSEFKNIKIDFIPTPVPRNYSTRVAIDTSRLSITYRYTITEPDSLEATIIDMQALEIGDRLNRFYSRYGEFRDSIMYENHLDFLRTAGRATRWASGLTSRRTSTPSTATCSHTEERTPAWCRNAL